MKSSLSLVGLVAPLLLDIAVASPKDYASSTLGFSKRAPGPPRVGPWKFTFYSDPVACRDKRNGLLSTSVEGNTGQGCQSDGLPRKTRVINIEKLEEPCFISLYSKPDCPDNDSDHIMFIEAGEGLAKEPTCDFINGEDSEEGDEGEVSQPVQSWFVQCDEDEEMEDPPEDDQEGLRTDNDEEPEEVDD